jgi:hypothetical protein
VTRAEDKWNSNVFGDPIVERSGRTNLNHNDKGRDGLFGNMEPADAYKKKESFAAAISQKQALGEPRFD